MGWYDAFRKSNVSNVDTKNITTSAGAGATAFGDAFKDFGKAMVAQDEADRTYQLNADKLGLEEQKTDADVAYKDAQTVHTTQTTQNEKQTYDDAFQEKENKEAQRLFNEEALKVSSTGGYNTMEEFTQANPELVKNADGTTMSKVEAFYTTKDTTKRDIADKTKDLKQATEINKLTAQLVKSKANQGFVYGQDTDTKIANIVGKAMGLESDMKTWDKDQTTEFIKKTTGIATISKQYGLTPLLATKLYEKQALQEAQLAEQKAKEEVKKPHYTDLKID